MRLAGQKKNTNQGYTYLKELTLYHPLVPSNSLCTSSYVESIVERKFAISTMVSSAAYI